VDPSDPRARPALPDPQDPPDLQDRSDPQVQPELPVRALLEPLDPQARRALRAVRKESPDQRDPLAHKGSLDPLEAWVRSDPQAPPASQAHKAPLDPSGLQGPPDRKVRLGLPVDRRELQDPLGRLAQRVSAQQVQPDLPDPKDPRALPVPLEDRQGPLVRPERRAPQADPLEPPVLRVLPDLPGRKVLKGLPEPPLQAKGFNLRRLSPMVTSLFHPTSTRSLFKVSVVVVAAAEVAADRPALPTMQPEAVAAADP
jgi:hypothetical protein